VNLLSNAVKFTFFGEISLISKLKETLGKVFLEFTVKDTGIGMGPEQKDKLFKVYSKGIQKNNEIGSGLGLSIVKDIIGKMN
jgi:signal transduction histidine kinase